MTSPNDDDRRGFSSRSPVNENPDRVSYRRGFVTKHHAIVLSRQAPSTAPVAAGPEEQAAADAAEGAVPPLAQRYDGPATLETSSGVRAGIPKVCRSSG